MASTPSGAAPRGRPRAFDRQKALASAMCLFWRQGYAATSMSDLCQAMGIASPSLYAAFGSKAELYAEALAYYAETYGPRIWAAVKAAPSARAAMEAYLLGSVTALPAQEGSPGGCMVTQAMEEEGCASPRGERIAVLDWLRDRLRRGVDEGELPRSVDVEALARFYQAVQQGMAVQARDGADAAALRGMALAALAAWPVLTQAAPATDSPSASAAG